MIDDEKLFKNRSTRKILNGEVRGILEMLGFSSLRMFSSQIGIGHETVAQILGLQSMVNKKQGFVAVSVHVALHTAYMEKRDQLSDATRRFICEWAEKWREDTLRDRIWSESPGKIKHEEPSIVVMKDRIRKRRKARAATVAAMNSLSWD